MYMYLFCNSIIFVDLYLVLKNPFQGRGSRVKWYYALCAIQFLVYTLVYTQTEVQVKKTVLGFHFKSRLYFQYLEAIFAFATLVAAILVLCRLG
jgi:hypothetical protein